jgi:hypothetical protein
MDEVEKVRSKLLEKYKSPAQVELVNTSILYVQKMIAMKTQDKQTQKWHAKYNFGADFLLQSIAECIDNGFALDGVNYVISGNRMYMPTYKAFKNKLYMVYPDTVIDLQLIREGDEYKFAKESGAVIYTHNIADPFAATEPKIIGAYCVIRNKRGEFLETLNRSDYQAMRDGSKNPKLWDTWESEFFLKSVIKRACKRHFNDITTALEEKDNEVIGIDDMVKATPDKKSSIIAAHKPQAETANEPTGAQDGDHNTSD